MIWTIARHEIRHLRRDGRLRAAGWLGLGLLAGLVLLGWQTWRRDLRERASFETAAREQWDHQGEKHPHRAAHFGFYLTKPELPLALVDSGLKPATGQVLWLEAHERSAFTYSPVEDAGAAAILGLTNGAEVLQLLGALLIVLTAYGSIAREREDGTLRLLLAQGVPPLRWFAGKCLGLAFALTALATPVALGLLALCIAAQPGGFTSDVAWRALTLGAGHALYFAAWLAGAVAVSAWSRSARGALATLLALWVAGGVLAPRLASTLASSFAPVPTLAEFRAAQGKDFNQGFDGEPGWDARLAALEKSTLAKYGVEKLDDVPVGFSGLRLQMMDAWSERISDRQQQHLEEIYTAQTRWHLATAALGPFVAMRAFSQGLAGMDWPHYRHFAEAAEVYRRSVVASMDQLLERKLVGDKWEVSVSHEVWSRVPPFTYAMPHATWALREAALPLALVTAWLVLALTLAWAGARRLSPL